MLLLLATCRRVNYKCLNRPQIGDALIKGPVTRPENKGLFLTRCAAAAMQQISQTKVSTKTAWQDSDAHHDKPDTQLQVVAAMCCHLTGV
jgi:hypothetical protein